jgi:acetyltransferase
LRAADCAGWGFIMAPPTLEGALPANERRSLHFAATPAGPRDGPEIEAFITGLTTKSRYQRFLHAMRSPSLEMIRAMLNFDPPRHATLLGFNIDDPGELIGIAQYSATSEPATCEVAVVVGDVWQRQGVATFLFRELARVARFGGFRSASAEILSDNAPALALARRWGASIAVSTGNAQLTRIVVPLGRRLFESRHFDRAVSSSRRAPLRVQLTPPMP